MDEIDDFPHPPVVDWETAIADGEADVAAGRTVPLEVVLADLGAVIVRMEAERRKQAVDVA